MTARWHEGRLVSLILESQPVAKSQPVTEFAERVQAHFNGVSQDFRDIPLELGKLTPFARRVYQAAQTIPAGSVATYKELAQALSSPGATRAVGTALGRNPFLLIVPCHRVVGANSSPGGFSAPGGLTTKALMLAAEGYGVESLWDNDEMARGFEHLLLQPHIKEVVSAVGPCPLQVMYPQDPFAALARNVLYQQLAGSAARAIEERVKKLGSAPFPSPDELLALPEETLRSAGLSGAKVQALWALSQAVKNGELKVEELRFLPDHQVVTEVSKVKGLGSWTAEMFLLFHLGRRDLLPVKDLGIRKGFQQLFQSRELPNAKTMERWAKPWRPYRSLASWYLWKSLEL